MFGFLREQHVLFSAAAAAALIITNPFLVTKQIRFYNKKHNTIILYNR